MNGPPPCCGLGGKERPAYIRNCRPFRQVNRSLRSLDLYRSRLFPAVVPGRTLRLSLYPKEYSREIQCLPPQGPHQASFPALKGQKGLSLFPFSQGRSFCFLFMFNLRQIYLQGRNTTGLKFYGTESKQFLLQADDICRQFFSAHRRYRTGKRIFPDRSASSFRGCKCTLL